MFTPSLYDPGLFLCVLAIAALMALARLIGQVLSPPHCADDDWFIRLTTQLILGLMFTAGICSIICLHRISYLVLIPAMLALFTVWSRKKAVVSSLTFSGIAARDMVPLVVAATGCIAFEWWQTGWVMPNGSLRVVHYDYGYWALLIKGMLASRSLDGWSATLGVHVNDLPPAGDSWYHWNPLVLAGGITSLTGMMPMASLMHVVAAALDITLVLVMGSIVRHLTRMSVAKSLIVAGFSMITVQIMVRWGYMWLGLDRQTDSLQHIRSSLSCFFAYKFDAMPLLLALLCWLRKQRPFALLLLACSAISAPHAVAVCGVTGGVLFGVGVLMRKKELWQTALSILAVVITTWACLHWLFGVGLPSLHGDALAESPTSMLREHLRQGFIEACSGLVLGAVSMPGILYLIFGKDERFTTETRVLGWMALCAVVGSYMGYRMLTGVADNWHVVRMSHAVLVMPVGVWGLACILSSRHARPARFAAIALMLFGGGMGAMDAIAEFQEWSQMPWKRGELDPLAKALNGEAFGYFAPVDRAWWLPWHSSLAAIMNVRCMRLQEIPTGNVERNLASNRPYQLLPPIPGETPDDWSIRFADKIGIRYAVDFSNNKIPEYIKAKSRKVVSVPYLTLYELPKP